MNAAGRLMRRKLALGVGTAASLVLLLAGGAAAQMQRMFPQKTQRAFISFVEPPQVLVGEQPERLGPGTRVRDQHNRVVLPGTLRGKTHLVNFQRDAAGVIREIWILTPREIERDQRPLAGDNSQPPSY